ncbi:MaoC family dehydratase N-terminal domain-containing protein (plasmid) [Rhodococcoides fascians]|uniref:FAS1-like dehydratase domain-containing protein n=1 Tax=Rhodococcoides fascians TaxID=1828 RepID=UPI003899CC79
MPLASESTLAEYVDGWEPGVERREDILHPGAANALAATLDFHGGLVAGTALPLLWHWAYFLDWPPTKDLGEDGHPAHGQFLPPIPSRRRMFAGGTVTVIEPLVLGERAVKTSSVGSVVPKKGRTGGLLFVTVRSEYSQDGHPKLIEEQNLVYRNANSAGAAPQRTSGSLGDLDAPWSAEPQPTPATLFRFSAATANAHRIHYDERYARDVEHYPALVVHGPLLAMYMADLATSRSGKAASSFSFRLSRPVFLGDRIRIEGRADGVDCSSADLRVSTGPTTVHATSRIEFQ